MKKIIKIMGIFAIMLCLVGFLGRTQVSANENKWQWKKDNTGWWLENNEGTYAKSEWSFVNGKWYLFNDAGYMKTGWSKDNGKWYFLNTNGDMATGWKEVGGKWYYLYTNGAMAENTTTPDGFKVNSNGEWTEAPSPNERPGNDTSNGYDGYINIGGVDIPKLKNFADNALTDPKGVWGADISGDRQLEDAIEEFSYNMKNDIINLGDKSNSGKHAQIAVTDYSIAAEINGDSTQSALILSKKDGHYEIYISSRLTYTEEDKELGNSDYTSIGNNALRLFCSVITPDGDLLYDTIFKAAEIDSSIIKKDSYTTFGNFQIKYRVEDRKAIVFSIKSK